MAYVAPTTRADGYVVDAAEWNKNTVDNPVALNAGAIAIASQATGDLIVASSASQLGRVADVAVGQVLASGGVGVAPAFTATPSVSGVVFPAVQVSSAGANTLDDYEEGDWTPVIGGSGGTSGQAYSLQVGKYVKVGKLVTCQFNVTLSTLGTITTNAQIQGLPFTSENSTNLVSICAISWGSLTTAVTTLIAAVQANTTAATLQAAAAASTSLSALVQADLSNTTNLSGTITYRATA